MKTFFEFKASTANSNAKLTIYNEIGFWGTSARSFYDQLKAVGNKDLDVYLNTPGGNVVDGYAIYNMLNRHPGVVTMYVDGVAGSIGSVIAMAGKKLVMPRNTVLFLHKPLVEHTEGNADDLRQMAENLDKIETGILSVYMAKSKKDEKTVRGWMKAETLFTAEEALKAGLADEVVDKVEVKALFKPADYFTNKAILDIFPNAEPAEGSNQPTNMSKELTDQIAALGKDKQDLTDKLKNAGPEAVAAYKAEERKRVDSLKAYAAKWNKDGDLDSPLAIAITDGISLDDFKDKVTEIISNRAGKPALKPGAGGGEGGGETTAEAKLLAEYQASKKKGGVAHSRFVRDNKKALTVLARGGKIPDGEEDDEEGEE